MASFGFFKVPRGFLRVPRVRFPLISFGFLRVMGIIALNAIQSCSYSPSFFVFCSFLLTYDIIKDHICQPL